MQQPTPLLQSLRALQILPFHSNFSLKPSLLHRRYFSSVHGDCAAPTFSLDWTAEEDAISLDWTAEEDALLQKGLLVYASESNSVMRYAKISALLNEKSIRDVALRHARMSKKEASKSSKTWIRGELKIERLEKHKEYDDILW